MEKSEFTDETCIKSLLGPSEEKKFGGDCHDLQMSELGHF